MAFLQNLLGGKTKDSQFQIEIGDAPTSTATAPAPEVPQASAAIVKATTTDIAPVAKATTAALVPVPAAEEATPVSVRVEPPKRQKTFRGLKKQPELAPVIQEVIVTPVTSPVIPPASAPPQPVAEVSLTTESMFASKFMNVGTKGRRRPGANMGSFLELARKVKT
ncbi:hypothetical protein [Roseofilum casamattae]|uniref:Translation initiation factor IF-2 n=1 Tax=Roseofilum casamattae BLCC-M143 TaxID=3022442 RepID=A0ABT7BUQ8_9CYAN|nr:hypothetical protein [Roseofilum casamattae]MDJ1182924.1 hypothetical protein [Roseofilum casamattae BLCC-M143]